MLKFHPIRPININIGNMDVFAAEDQGGKNVNISLR